MSDTELEDNKSEILDVCEDENINEDEVEYSKYFWWKYFKIFWWQGGSEILQSSSSAFSLVRPGGDKMASPFLPTSSPPGNVNQLQLSLCLKGSSSLSFGDFLHVLLQSSSK